MGFPFQHPTVFLAFFLAFPTPQGEFSNLEEVGQERETREQGAAGAGNLEAGDLEGGQKERGGEHPEGILGGEAMARLCPGWGAGRSHLARPLKTPWPLPPCLFSWGLDAPLESGGRGLGQIWSQGWGEGSGDRAGSWHGEQPLPVGP